MCKYKRSLETFFHFALEKTALARSIWWRYCVSMDAYILPNGARIDAGRVVEAMLAESEDGYPRVYLNTKTGVLVEIPFVDNLRRWEKEVGEDRRLYVHIEPLTDEWRSAVARDYITGLLPDMAPSVAPGAVRALEEGGWRNMEQFLTTEGDGWIHGWYQFLSDEAWEHMDDWLTDHPDIRIKMEFEGCGNCSLCELIRRGEDGDPEKLAKAFAMENAMQNVEQEMQLFMKKKDGK